MRPFTVFLAMVMTVAVVGYLLVSPVYLGDLRWLIVALPISLVILREIYEHVPGMASPARRGHRGRLVIEPLEGDALADCEEEPDAWTIDGLWTGTVRVWPALPTDALVVLPLSLWIDQQGRTVEILRAESSEKGPHVTDVAVVEYDQSRGYVDLSLTLEIDQQWQTLDARLVLHSARMEPEDEPARVTVELRRAVLRLEPFTPAMPLAATA
ncbi:MAG: hypothetical protein GXY55_01880 [Phycisphaerae bacterium]|nr:hypothetical protein [Phycisphaerae bacterium]